MFADRRRIVRRCGELDLLAGSISYLAESAGIKHFIGRCASTEFVTCPNEVQPLNRATAGAAAPLCNTDWTHTFNTRNRTQFRHRMGNASAPLLPCCSNVYAGSESTKFGVVIPIALNVHCDPNASALWASGASNPVAPIFLAFVPKEQIVAL